MNMLFHSVFFFFLLGVLSETREEDPFYLKRKKMVDSQICARGIDDRNVLQAMLNVRRHLFVPDNEKINSYEDYPLSIGYNQTISQPYIVGYMTSSLMLKESDIVLEIGTGSGYQTAILADIVKEVYTIEIIRELSDASKARFKELGYNNIHIKCGDGYKGWPEIAPFDAIIVTACPEEIPSELIGQLKVGGKMIIPVGDTHQRLMLISKNNESFNEQDMGAVRFVPMVKSV